MTSLSQKHLVADTKSIVNVLKDGQNCPLLTTIRYDTIRLLQNNVSVRRILLPLLTKENKQPKTDENQLLPVYNS